MKTSKKYLHLQVPADLHKALRVRAARIGVSMTDLIKQIVMDALKKK